MKYTRSKPCRAFRQLSFVSDPFFASNCAQRVNDFEFHFGDVFHDFHVFGITFSNMGFVSTVHSYVE